MPKGTSVVSCDAATGCPGVTASSGTFYYLFNLNQDEKGNPNVITGDQVSASSDTDPTTGQPIVTLSYKNGGGAEFTNISRSLAQQARAAGMADGKINPPNGLPNAIVVDGQLVATPVVDPDENPNGIDATLQRQQRDQRPHQVRGRPDRARGAVRLAADQVHGHVLQQRLGHARQGLAAQRPDRGRGRPAVRDDLPDRPSTASWA